MTRILYPSLRTGNYAVQKVVNARVPQHTCHWIDAANPTGYDPYIAIPNLFELYLTIAAAWRELKDTAKHKGKHLAHVANDDLSLGKRSKRPEVKRRRMRMATSEC